MFQSRVLKTIWTYQVERDVRRLVAIVVMLRRDHPFLYGAGLQDATLPRSASRPTETDLRAEVRRAAVPIRLNEHAHAGKRLHTIAHKIANLIKGARCLWGQPEDLATR